MKIALDYTEDAAPLTIDRLKLGVDAFDSLTGGGAPSKIIMWQHQLDWLIKEGEARLGGPVALHVREGVRIWSIPLEVRE